MQGITRFDENLYGIKSPFTCGAEIYVRSYLVVGSIGVVLVDGGVAGTEQQVLALLEELDLPPDRLDAVLLTHAHADHAGAARGLREATGCAVVGHRMGAPLLRDKQLMYKDFMGAYPADITVPDSVREQWFAIAGPPVTPDVLIDRGHLYLEMGGTTLETVPFPGQSLDPLRYFEPDRRFRIDLGGLSLEVIPAPGHSWDHLSYYERERGWLFTGDGVCGNGPYEEPPCYRDSAVYSHTLRRLMELSTERLFPGHFDVLDTDGAAAMLQQSLQTVNRIDAIIKAQLRRAPSGLSLETIGRHLADEIGKGYMIQALFTAEAHLRELERQGLVARYGIDQPTFVWL